MLNLNRHFSNLWTVWKPDKEYQVKMQAPGRGGGGEGGGVILGILGGVCRPVLQILTLFQTQKMSFSTPVFRPDF